jgi:hypothetical protein
LCAKNAGRAEQFRITSGGRIMQLSARYYELEVLALGQETKTVKRRFPRVKLPKGMLVAWQHTGGRSVSRVATLGLGGLFISTSDPPSIGAVVKIVFDVPGGEVRARAIVKNVKAGQGMAVAFIEMGYADRARLDQLLKKLT